MTNSKPLRVLYADNDEDARLMVTTILGFSGIDVTSAETIAEGWRLSRLESFDLYLLDSRFSDGSGLDLCRQLRAHAPQTPILFYSGDAYDTDKEKGLAAGADIYLTKPYRGDLGETILNAIWAAALNSTQNFRGAGDCQRLTN